MDKQPTTAFLDLYVEEPVLGSPSRFVREAGVEFGKATVEAVPDDELPALAQRRLDLVGRRFTQLLLPFDLQDLPGSRRYVEATVRMTFDDPAVGSLSLARPPSDGSPDDAEIDTWGVGRPQLTWKLTAKNERLGIRPHGRQVLAVLESPFGSDWLTGTLDASVCFTRQLLGQAIQSRADAKRPLPFSLNVVDGLFEFVPDQ